MIALNNTKNQTKAFEQTMTGASGAARNFAQSNIVTADSIKKFASNQRIASGATKALTLETIALNVAAAALNATITFGISLAIEGLIHLINLNHGFH